MNDQEHDAAKRDEEPVRPPAPEVHRERELIVTSGNGGGRGSGASTAIVVIFALVAIAILAFLAFTFFERDGNNILPDDIDINIEVPSIEEGS